jgi:hypothetical protein
VEFSLAGLKGTPKRLLATEKEGPNPLGMSEVHSWIAEMGRKGGSAKTPEKRKASHTAMRSSEAKAFCTSWQYRSQLRKT